MTVFARTAGEMTGRPSGPGASTSVSPRPRGPIPGRQRQRGRAFLLGRPLHGGEALLCHRLGADRVTSVDVDPSLVEAARAQLASIGYSPHLVTADGAHGAPHRAPFDKIIATVASPGYRPRGGGRPRPAGPSCYRSTWPA